MADPTLVQVPETAEVEVPEKEATPSVSPYAAVGQPYLPPQTQTELEALAHFDPDYPYRPDLYFYEELYTSDPAYVVVGVKLMPTEPAHQSILDGMQDALRLLCLRGGQDWHVAVDVAIRGIPSSLLGREGPPRKLAPDASVWNRPLPSPDAEEYETSFHFERDGVPRLALEVVSRSAASTIHNDLVRKVDYYARMGIPEYWIVDHRNAQVPLQILYLDADIASVYVPRKPSLAPDGSQALRSRVLPEVWLRWNTASEVKRRLEVCEAADRRWKPLLDIPLLEHGQEKLAEGRAEERLANLRALLADSLPEAQLASLENAWERSERPLPDMRAALAVTREPRNWQDLWPSDVPRP